MEKTGMKLSVFFLLFSFVLALTGCGGGNDSSPAVTYKFTTEMFSGNSFTVVSSDGFNGTSTFNPNGDVTNVSTGGTSVSTWQILSSGQLKVTHTDGSYDVVTRTNSSTTTITGTDQYTDPLRPSDNRTSTMTITPITPVYKFTTEMVSGKSFAIVSSDGFNGTATFNSNGNVTTVSTSGTSVSTWSINSSGQLRVAHTDGSYDVFTRTNSSTTTITGTDQYTDPAHPSDNSTLTMTLTLIP